MEREKQIYRITLLGSAGNVLLVIVKFVAGANPWQVVDKVDCAFPCSRQNELNGADAAYLIKHGCKLVGSYPER